MNSLQQAIAINNEGVQLLNSGSITDALRVLQSAVVVMKEASQVFADSAKALPPSAVASLTHNDCSQFCLDQGTGCTLVGLQNDNCYVYDRPLLIPTDLKISTQEDLHSAILISSTWIVFNFALALHQLGMISGKDAPLRRAVGLYDLTLRMLCRSDIDESMNAVLRCLALNNLAQLQYEYCEYEKSKYCTDCMYDLAVSTGCLDSSCSYLSESDIDEIKWNLVHLHPPTVAKAA